MKYSDEPELYAGLKFALLGFRFRPFPLAVKCSKLLEPLRPIPLGHEFSLCGGLRRHFPMIRAGLDDGEATMAGGRGEFGIPRLSKMT